MIPYYKKPVFNLPDGPKNLAALFPDIDFNQVDEYSVTLKGPADAILVTTPINKTGCCCNDDTVRIHFENYLGKWDAVNFDRIDIETDVTSSSFKKSLPLDFIKTDTGAERFNVRSNELYTAVTSCYPEDAMPWLMELAASGKALMEWSGQEGQADSFIPVKVLDGKFTKKKSDDNTRYIYFFSVQFQLSNEKITIRN
jgi:hypothetical protein